MANRLVPGKTNSRIPWFKNWTIIDILVATVGIAVCGLTLWGLIVLKLEFLFIFAILGVEVILFATSLIEINETRIYMYYVYMVSFWFRKKKFSEATLKSRCGINITSDTVKSESGVYSKVLKINGTNLSLVSESVQDMKISILGDAFALNAKFKIVKLDEVLSFEDNLAECVKARDLFLERFEKLDEKSDDYKKQSYILASRIEALNIDIEIYENIIGSNSVMHNTFYFIIYGSSKEELEFHVDETLRYFSGIGLNSYPLNEKELKKFYEVYFESEFDGNNEMKLPSIKEKVGSLTLGELNYKIVSLSSLPLMYGNAWMAPLFSMDGVRVVVNSRLTTDMSKTFKRISKNIINLESLLLLKKSEAEKMDIESKIFAMRQLLADLKIGQESLHVVEITIMYLNDKATTRKVRSLLKHELRCSLDSLTFRQYDAYANTMPYLASKNFKAIQRDFQSSSFAGSFPFVSDLFFDKRGDYIGYNSNPVVFDLWSNLNTKGGTRTNSNLMILGSSGKGKSYFMKLLLKNQIEKDTKIYILDPENEYKHISHMFGGEIIDVTGGDIKINPFEVFPELVEGQELTSGYGLVGKHLSFLADFFKITLPYISDFARDMLTRIVEETYALKGINNYSPINDLKSTDFPTFDDLIDVVEKWRSKKLLESEMNSVVQLSYALAQFRKEGRFGQLWNGHTTLSLNNDFTIFNFRGVDGGSNDEVKNAQMLLITKFISRDIINNYEANLKLPADKQKRIILAIDEAHNFIDPQFRVALTMMKSMSKRIRKYSGSLWVTTQNIADFTGGDANTKKDATAIINNCQYTMLFGVKANDVQSIKEMYATSASSALTEEELNYLSTAGQGDALLLVDAGTRVSFRVAFKDKGLEELFVLPQKEEETKEKEDIEDKEHE